MKRALWTMLLLSGFACSRGPVLHGQIAGIRDVAREAEESGARRCAPRQLAVAIAHADFAETELEQGDLARAEEHIRIAAPNARAAQRLSPRLHCVDDDRDHDGIFDRVDRCIDVPEDLDGHDDTDGCPEGEDRDGDGIMDDVDHCPDEAEDRDNFDDGDGCPDPDNDQDRILDAADHCPLEPEDRDGFEDDDGCPDTDNDHDGILDRDDACPNEAGPRPRGCPEAPHDVELTEHAIVIRQQVFFETDRATIRPVSFDILNQVASIMRAHPEVRIEVQGHTDSRGADRRNLRLSDARAHSVRDFLIQAGVEPARLTARGFGETSPIESNSTTSGRAANRRVEFVRGDSGTPAARP